MDPNFAAANGRTKCPAPWKFHRKYLTPAEGHPLSAAFRVLLNRMIHAIDNNLPSPAPNFQDGLNSQIMLDTARLSAAKGTWIDL
jgi:hypothetical protein